MPLSIKPVKAVINENHSLVIEWDFENHLSEFLPGWLQAHCYSDEARDQRQYKPQTWDRNLIEERLPRFAYQSVMQSDETLLGWLKDLRSFGISLIENVDTTPDTVGKVAQRISFIRETNFGTLFDVKSKPRCQLCRLYNTALTTAYRPSYKRATTWVTVLTLPSE